MDSFDLAVVGLGPAGSAAAITAAKRGLNVVAIDKATFPRDKCCGDGLTTGALRLLENLGLDQTTLPSWQTINNVWISGPRRKPLHFELPKDQGQFAATVRRIELDDALLALTVAAGAEVRTSTTLVDLTLSESSSKLHTNSGSIAAAHVIAADGMWSPTRKLLGLNTDGYRGEWHGFRQYFHNVSASAARDLWVWFEPDLLPGYFWSFPLAGGMANVGFGIQRGRGISIQQMKGLWPELLARPHIAERLGPNAEPEAPHKAWPIPARLGRVPSHHGPVLFVGDAAAATDPMTGEGIGQALQTGVAAAEAVLARPGPDAGAGLEYAQNLSAGLRPDHRLAATLSNILARPAAAEACVRTVGLSDWTRRNFARWLFEDYPRAIITTPKRWRRGITKGPGAFQE